MPHSWLRMQPTPPTTPFLKVSPGPSFAASHPLPPSLPPIPPPLQIHPRGVQLELLPLSAPEAAQPLVDTLVMSNLGYFQLKTGPGLWKLKLAPGAGGLTLWPLAAAPAVPGCVGREHCKPCCNAHAPPTSLELQT